MTTVMDLLSKLAVDEQIQVYSSLYNMIKHGQRVNAAKAGASFLIGQIVKFDDKKTRSTKFIRIEKFNRAGTCVVGYECDKDGSNKTNMRWTVANSFCTVV
jgi:hypothetical protein